MAMAVGVRRERMWIVCDAYLCANSFSYLSPDTQDSFCVTRVLRPELQKDLFLAVLYKKTTNFVRVIELIADEM
jgi:hypothetical protein